MTLVLPRDTGFRLPLKKREVRRSPLVAPATFSADAYSRKLFGICMELTHVALHCMATCSIREIGSFLRVAVQLLAYQEAKHLRIGVFLFVAKYMIWLAITLAL